MSRPVRLCLLGFGHANRRLTELLGTHQNRLREDHDVEFRITAVGTARHGSLLATEGLSATAVLDLVSRTAGHLPDPPRPGPALIAASRADILVEATPLEPRGTTAISHLEAAFAHGMDAVTVNKGPIAWDYRRVRAAADRAGRQLRFEGITMDGCPVYNLVESCLPGIEIRGFHGVLNATTNYVLDAMAQGGSLDDAVAEAQRDGFAEADPNDDLDGRDAAAKVAALANVLLDAGTTPDHIPRAGLHLGTAQQAQTAFAAGQRLRMACHARRRDDGALTAAVELVTVGPDHPYFDIGGTSSILVLETDLMGDIEIVERNGLVTQTAYALYADLLTVVARRRQLRG